MPLENVNHEILIFAREPMLTDPVVQHPIILAGPPVDDGLMILRSNKLSLDFQSEAAVYVLGLTLEPPKNVPWMYGLPFCR